MGDDKREFNEIEFEQPLEEAADTSDIEVSKRTIYTDQGDPEISGLYKKFKKGRLDVQPDFQRYFVWDINKSSRLIESSLLEIPLPIIYLAEDKNDKVYVIDGQQRLTSFFSYIDGNFPDGKEFKLTGLKVFKELNGKSFKDIDEKLQDKIQDYKIRTITFKKESEPDLRFEIFERLNTGSVPLNDQELRNCTYRGAYNDLLKKLSEDGDFRYILGLKTSDKRMNDVALVLRFAAFYHSTYLHYKPPIRKFLNNDIEKFQDISEKDANELKQAFKNSVAIIKSLLDTHAFKRFYRGSLKNPNGSWEFKKFNAALYDVLMYTFARQDKNIIYRNLDSIREAFIYLMTNDEEFINSIEISTSTVQAITKRFDKWRLALQEIVGILYKETRCFSFSLKRELFDMDPTCSICGNKINNIDDSSVDHIEQYWTGGKTIPENARLTHRFCNWSRSRGDMPPIEHKEPRFKRRSLGETKKKTGGIPQPVYELPILDILISNGGSMRAEDVLSSIELKMRHLFNSIDREQIDASNERWRINARFRRNNMRVEGLLKNNSPKGTWEISEQGKIFFEENKYKLLDIYRQF